jgi:hypothetical protein
MSSRNRKKLVIDANLALGSSDPMFNPLSVIAGDVNRRCLDAIWEEGHIAVFNKRLRREWRDHLSDSARKWLRSMNMKGRTIDEEGEDFSELLDPACGCQAVDRHKADLEKDFHLVQSALATEQIIISRETNFPAFIAKACSAVRELASLYYANPIEKDDACRLWIKAGADKVDDRRIDNWAEKHPKIDE